MGKQSTLGKFWGKPASAVDSTKTDEEKNDDKDEKKAISVDAPSENAGSQSVAGEPSSSGNAESGKKASSSGEAAADKKPLKAGGCFMTSTTNNHLN